MNILQRAAAPTPSFFKKLRLIGLILTTASGVLIGGDMTAGVVLEIVKHLASVFQFCFLSQPGFFQAVAKTIFTVKSLSITKRHSLLSLARQWVLEN